MKVIKFRNVPQKHNSQIILKHKVKIKTHWHDVFHVCAMFSKYLSVIGSSSVSQFIIAQMDLPFSKSDNLCVTSTDPEHVTLLIFLSELDLLPNLIGALSLLLLPLRQKSNFSRNYQSF